MFASAGRYSDEFILNLSGWDVSNVTDMSAMFSGAGYNAKIWNIGDFSNWNVSQVTTMSDMFREAGYKTTEWNIGDISNWDVSKVTLMNSMFYYAGYNTLEWNIGNLSNWKTSNLEGVAYMFAYAGYNSKKIELDLSGWDTTKVKYEVHSNGWVNSGMENMFAGMRRLHTITLGPNFSTTGDGTVTNFTLPTPDTSYFPNADGYWRNVATGQMYLPSAIPSNKAATYTIEAPAEAFAIYSEEDNSLRFYKNGDLTPSQ